MSNTSYKQIIPASDWYFRHENVSGVAEKLTLYQLAAWALKENGEIVGLVTVRDDNGRPNWLPRYFIRTPYNGVLASQTRHDYCPQSSMIRGVMSPGLVGRW